MLTALVVAVATRSQVRLKSKWYHNLNICRKPKRQLLPASFGYLIQSLIPSQPTLKNSHYQKGSHGAKSSRMGTSMPLRLQGRLENPFPIVGNNTSSLCQSIKVQSQFNQIQQHNSVNCSNTIQSDAITYFSQLRQHNSIRYGQQHISVNYSSTIRSDTTVYFSQLQQHNSIRYNSIFQSTKAAQFDQIQQHISVNYSSTIQSDTTAYFSQLQQHNSIRYNSVFQSTIAAQFNQIQQYISIN